MSLNLLTPINENGYGVAGYNFWNSLLKLGKDVSLFPIPDPNRVELPQDKVEQYKQSLIRARMFEWNAPCLRIWHQFDMAHRVGYGSMFGMPIFELDTFNDIEKHHLNHLDCCIVNSEWAREVVNNNCSVETEVIPLGVDNSVFYPDNSKRQRDHQTVFLNMGKWEIRKGHDILADAFNKAFTKNDDVVLKMCCTNRFYSEEENRQWEKYYKNSSLGDKIEIIPRLKGPADVAALMNSADCGVFPSRGEGWNLEALEMMACGKHIIITNYSAHTEFCNSDNSYLINIDEVEPAFDGKWFFNQGNWAKLGKDQMEQLVEHMRSFHRNRSLIYNREGHKTSLDYTWDKAAALLWRVVNG